MVSHLRFWYHNLHSWFDRILVLGFSVLLFSQFECKVIHSSHNLVYPSLLVLSLRISHIWRFWLLEDLESSTKKNSGKISSQFLKFLLFRAQFWGSHNDNSQFRSEIDGLEFCRALLQPVVLKYIQTCHNVLLPCALYTTWPRFLNLLYYKEQIFIENCNIFAQSAASSAFTDWSTEQLLYLFVAKHQRQKSVTLIECQTHILSLG